MFSSLFLELKAINLRKPIKDWVGELQPTEMVFMCDSKQELPQH